MNYQKLTISLSLLLMTGCQTGLTGRTGLSQYFFGPDKHQHTFEQRQMADKQPSSAAAQVIADDDYQLGEQAMQRGDWKQAKGYFLDVVKSAPENAKAHHRLGFISDKMKDYTFAEIHYLAAMRIEPNNPDIACDLGYSYLLQNRDQESRRYLEKALSMNPGHTASLMNLASLHARNGDYNTTASMLRRALPEHEVQANLARLFPNGIPSQSSQIQMARNQQAPHPLDPTEHSNRPGQPTNREQIDLTQLDPRKIPPDQINDIFAQIDEEFKQKQKQARELTFDQDKIAQNSPVVTEHQQMVANVSHDNRQLSPQETNVTPELSAVEPRLDSQVQQATPTQPTANPLEEYAVVGMGNQQAATPVSETSMTQQPPALQLNSTDPGTMPTAPMLTQPQMPAVTTQPTPSNPNGTVTNDADYQRKLALALQMGMNAGPGQLFPLESSSNSLATPTAITPAEKRPSTSNYYPGHMRLQIDAPIQQPTNPSATHRNPVATTTNQQATTYPLFDRPMSEQSQPYMPQSNPVPTMAHSGNQQQQSSPSMRLPANTSTEIPNWPHAPQNSQPTMQQVNGQEQPEARNVQMPWHENQQQPLIYAQPDDGSVQPQQWPHSPQQAPQQQPRPEMMIHRGTEQPSMPQASPEQTMPQISPGYVR